MELKTDCKDQVVPQGCPIVINVQIKNISDKKITFSQRTKEISLEIRDEGGKIVEQPLERRIMETSSLESKRIELEPNWKKDVDFTVTYIDKVGKYKIKSVLNKKGPFYYRNEENRLVQFEAWEGKIESNECIVEVKSPEGIDRDAYNYFKGNPLSPDNTAELLQKYPTSTYAGYVLAG
ncbi:MAG: hypothetical protein N2445_08785, partial [Acidobacteria bacterium]|nr:hypothetical protein [Acidobacteriota bacterium]